MPFTKFNSRNLLQVPEKRTFSLASLVSKQGFDQNINLQYSREYRNLNKFAYIFKRPTKFTSRKWELGSQSKRVTTNIAFLHLANSFICYFLLFSRRTWAQFNLSMRNLCHFTHVKSKKSCMLKENYSVVTFFIRYCYAFSIF